jgi:hypothetical protein
MLLATRTGSGLSVLVTTRLFRALIVVTSVSLLLAGTESTTPAGGVTVAVLERVPVALGETVPLTVYVMDEPTGRSTVSLMLPAPAGVLPVAPPDATLVNVTLVKLAGNRSVTVASATPSVPGLLTTIV